MPSSMRFNSHWSWVESEKCISDRLSSSFLMDQTNNQYLSKETSNSWTNN
ncbi:unnamed protein product [Musa banksii]